MKIPYSSTIDEFKIINEANFNEYYDKSVTFLRSDNNFIKVFSGEILNDGDKLILDLSIVNEGASGTEVTTRYDLYIRLSRYSLTSLKGDVKITTFNKPNNLPRCSIVANRDTTNNKWLVDIYINSVDTFSLYKVNPNFVYPRNVLEDLKEYNVRLTSTEMTTLKNSSTTYFDQSFTLALDNLISDGDIIPVVNNKNSLGNTTKVFKNGYFGYKLKIPFTSTNDYSSEDLDGNGILRIDSSLNKLMHWNNSSKKWVDTSVNFGLECLASKPTDNLFNGRTFFHSSTNKIMTYNNGSWYSNGGIV